MPQELFQTEEWFRNLIANGFEVPPRFHLKLPLGAPDDGAYFWFMQQSRGAPLLAVSNYYSSLYGPVHLGKSAEVLNSQWSAFAKSLRGVPGSAVLRLQPLDGESDWLGPLQKALKGAGYVTDRFFCFSNWYQTAPSAGYNAYWANRPSALRNNVNRGRKRLDRAGSWRIDIHTSDSDSVAEALAAYEAVYSQSWKNPEPCPNFMPGLVHMALRHGWLRLGVLWLRERPIAAQVWLVHGAKANIYKLAYVEGQGHFSPGSVLTAAMMKHVMDIDCVREVDYLSGDDAYKVDWMAQRRERIGLVAFHPSSWRGWRAGILHFLGRARRLALRN